jgi:excisionase family DNA binding protein
MKKTTQIESADNSYSVGEAASLLGLSIPTVKRMAQARTVDTFRTPGGHLRVLAESVEAIKEQRRSPARSAHAPSSVLQNRRERLEELNLETQEHRARRELTKLQREEQEEAERQEAEAQSREEEAAQRQAEFDLERERLEHEKAQERRHLERERAEERARMEAEEESAAFRERWYDAAAQAVATPKLAWLAAAQRKETTEALEAEINRYQPADEPRMPAVIARSLEALVEPLRAERDAQERRQSLTKSVLWSLPCSATDGEKVQATDAIREALRRFDSFADVYEMRAAAQEAIQPIRRTVEKRTLDERLLAWAIRELPWSRTDRDAARIRRECAEIIGELAEDLSEPEGKEALEPTVREASAEIQQRQAEKDRQARKAGLIQQGVAEVLSYLMELTTKGEISNEDCWDSAFQADLKETVRVDLGAGLTGDEATKEVRQHVRKIIDDQLN